MQGLRWAPVLLSTLITTGATCNRDKEVPTADSAVVIDLPGVDTTSLTKREKTVWSDHVKELLSPCPEVAVPLAECVRDKRNCDTCVPAANYVKELVQAGLPETEVTAMYAERFDPKEVKTIVIGDSPSKGAEDPAVTIVEFADFECPACGQAFPLLEMMYEKFGDRMRIVFKHYPLAVHPNAKLAARASYAAGQQGQFWKMHRILFENQRALTEPDLMGYAAQMGLDMKRFKADIVSDEAKEAVDQEKRQGESLGVKGTPTIFINGRSVNLPKLPNPVSDLEKWIQLEIELHDKQRGGKPAPKAEPAKAAPDGDDDRDAPGSTTASAAASATGTAPAPAPAP